MSHKQYTIREIARLAGVSTGTVDRVIHNRGEVSERSRRLVEETLKKFEYKPSLSVSSLSTKRSICIVAVLPEANTGYWASMKQGIKQALYEFAHVKMKLKFLHYNQFDLFSFRNVCEQALKTDCDAVLLGPTFSDETRQFACELEVKGIPYVLVDENTPGTNPLAYFGPDSKRMGYIQAKLLMGAVEPGKEILMLRTKRVGDVPSTNALIHREGFQRYLQDKDISIPVLDTKCDVSRPESNREVFDRLFEEHPDIGGIVVFNSRAYIMANYLKSRKMHGIKMVGYGLVDQNIKALREDYITFLLSERPNKQGYLAVKCILEYLLFRKQGSVINYTPVDILISENIDYYLGSLDL